jgi:DNA-binding transcriptional LysR family regulator
MHFNKLDLNLLVAFDALATELNITRAAEQLSISQPAMSHALRRLRTYFDDELLVQVGRKMELTPRARVLHEAVSEMLTKLEITLSSTPAFDPSASDRTFTISVSDYSLELMVPKMLSLAAAQNSRVKFRLEPQIKHPDRPLDKGEIDLLVIPQAFCSPQHPSTTLFDDRLVCAEWRDSGQAARPMTVDRFVTSGHIAMVPADASVPAFETWIEEAFGTGRRIEVLTYNFSSLPYMVVGTPYIALVQERLATALHASLPIVLSEPPLPLPVIRQSMQWHKYRSDDAGLAWLRTLVQQSIQSIDADPHPGAGGPESA